MGYGRLAKFGVAAALLSVCGGCSRDRTRESLNLTASHKDAIVIGTDSLGIGRTAPIDDQDQFRGVVRPFFNDTNSDLGLACSGTLVTCRHVLTAQHCLKRVSNQVHVDFVQYTPQERKVTR